MIYSIKANGYNTRCYIRSRTIVGAIKCAITGLSVNMEDILEIKRVFAEIDVEFTTSK